MNIEQALYNQLTAYAGLSALISGRVYPLRLPDTPTLPAVTYRRITGPREPVMGGALGLVHPRFQLTVFAETYDGVKTTAEQARKAVDGFSGTLGGVGGVAAACWVVNDFDFQDLETDWWLVIIDVMIWYAET